MNSSLGLIEVKGFCASIFTADVILKNSSVQIRLQEINNGNILLKLNGALPQINYAVNLGIENANKISSVINYIVLENPNPEIEKVFFLNNRIHRGEKLIDKTEPITLSSTVKNEFTQKEPTIRSVKASSSGKKQKPSLHKSVKNKSNLRKEILTETKSNTIERLRLEALGKQALQNSTSSSDKGVRTKIYDIKKLSDLDGLNVHKLRRAARDFEEFPIKGRQISMADREELMSYFRQILPE